MSVSGSIVVFQEVKMGRGEVEISRGGEKVEIAWPLVCR